MNSSSSTGDDAMIITDEGTGMFPVASSALSSLSLRPDIYSNSVHMAWSKPTTTVASGGKGENVPGPRAAHSCDLIGNTLYVFGGWNGRRGLNDLHCLNVTTLEWSIPTVSGEVPSSRNNHASFVYGNKIFFHGGHDGTKWLGDFHVLDTDTMTFSLPLVSGTPPLARACHTMTIVGRKVYMFGGYNGEVCFNQLDVLDLDTMTWLQPRVTGPLPQCRNAQTVTAVGTKLYLFGGHSGHKHLRDLHILDTEGLKWSTPETKGSAPHGIRGHSATLIGDKLYVFGGFDGVARRKEMFLLSIADGRWEHPPTNELTPTERQRHTACLIDGKKLFVLGGFDGQRWMQDLHILDLAKLEESAITMASVTTLLDDLRPLINNADMFPDVTFEIGGQPIYAHRAILAARSAHFKAMFSSGMRESRAAVIKYDEGGWSRAAFIAMLEFLYTGSIGALQASVAADVMGLSDQVGLDSLKARCEATLIESVDVSNVCSLILLAHRYRAAKLKRSCLDFIIKHHDGVHLNDLAVEPTLLIDITKEVFGLLETR